MRGKQPDNFGSKPAEELGVIDGCAPGDFGKPIIIVNKHEIDIRRVVKFFTTKFSKGQYATRCRKIGGIERYAVSAFKGFACEVHCNFKRGLCNLRNIKGNFFKGPIAKNIIAPDSKNLPLLISAKCPKNRSIIRTFINLCLKFLHQLFS